MPDSLSKGQASWAFDCFCDLGFNVFRVIEREKKGSKFCSAWLFGKCGEVGRKLFGILNVRFSFLFRTHEDKNAATCLSLTRGMVCTQYISDSLL